MSAVNEQLVREYFELNGFLVRELRKSVGPRDGARSAASADFAVCNPTARGGGEPPPFELDGRGIARVSRAAVLVLGWHTKRIYARHAAGNSEIGEFVDRAASYEELIPGRGRAALRLLVAPGLPTGPARDRAEEALRERGLDAVLPFGQLLAELTARVETNRNYARSDVLQTLRLLKLYNLLRDPQLEFFQPKRRRPRRDR